MNRLKNAQSSSIGMHCGSIDIMIKCIYFLEIHETHDV